MKLHQSLLSPVKHLATQEITIGVTGFSRAGKTVFIGSLAQALLTTDAWKQHRGQGPLAQFGPFERGEIRSASIRDDIHTHLPHFPFRKVRDSLLDLDAHWPDPTVGISRLVLDLDTVPRTGIMSKISKKVGLQNVGFGHIQLELVDYPGEWLIDFAMLEQSYEQWSKDMLARACTGIRATLSAGFLCQLEQIPDDAVFDEEVIGRLADAWEQYLRNASVKGFTMNQPGRLLRPDELRHSPILRLVPLPERYHQSKFFKGMSKRFAEYKTKIIKPFYRKHFSRMDRQIVLVDILQTLQGGQAVFEEMTEALALTLRAFNYGKGGWLSHLPWIGKTTHVLFAATKADHVTRHDRANLEQLLRRMLSALDSDNRLRADVARHEVIALASVRATKDYRTEKSPRREVLHGKPAGEPEVAQWDPGNLPLDYPPRWPDLCFHFYNFEPTPMPAARLEGFPSINLGKALDFLIGEDIR